MRGRRRERETLNRLLDEARAGRGGALVLCGEPGIGKTVLLDYLWAQARVSSFRLLRTRGVECETDLAYAALHQLTAVLSDGLDRLPEPRRDALATAFGLCGSGVPDRFLVGLGVLGLMSDAARQDPMLCVVDDAQWLDQASAAALSLVVRRIETEPMLVVFAVRDPCDRPELAGLPRLLLEGLEEADARALFASLTHVTLDDQVCDRLIKEAWGNPSVLREIAHGAGPAELAGGFAVPTIGPASSAVERDFRERLRTLPAETRDILLVMAAEPVGDPVLVWRAAERLGLDPTAVAPAVTDALVEVDTRVRFRHPLLRSIVYRSASVRTRQRAHGALAAATDPAVDADRRAWHLGQTTLVPDEEVATELERTADRAKMRAGIAASAAFLERAAVLTPDPGRRVDRTLMAARLKWEAGAFESALSLLSDAQVASLDELQQARLDAIRAQSIFTVRHDPEAVEYFLRSADRLKGLDPPAAREHLLDALAAAMLLGRATSAMEAAVEAARKAPPAPSPPRKVDLLLDSVLLLLTGGRRAAVPVIKSVLADVGDAVWTSRPGLAWMLTIEIWDSDAFLEFSTRLVESGREAGSLVMLSTGLAMLATAAIHSGDVEAAVPKVTEEEDLAAETGAAEQVYPRLHVAALRGHKPEAAELIDKVAGGDGPGSLVVTAEWAAVVRHNSLADYSAALKTARHVADRDEMIMGGLVLSELIEAAVRCDDRERAVAAYDALTDRVEASRTDWALGVHAYCGALIADEENSEANFRTALKHLQASGMAIYLARAHLLFGEWLRRRGRRQDARHHLNTAHEMLAEMGAEAFVERAAVELRATGERVGRRGASATDQLTTQELQIARLVASGATTKEVAVQLFLSRRTVDAHLRNIFTKLGLTSRRQLKELKL